MELLYEIAGGVGNSIAENPNVAAGSSNASEGKASSTNAKQQQRQRPSVVAGQYLSEAQRSINASVAKQILHRVDSTAPLHLLQAGVLSVGPTCCRIPFKQRDGGVGSGAAANGLDRDQFISGAHGVPIGSAVGGLDPFETMCRFDLHGRCDVSDCRWQHSSDLTGDGAPDERVRAQHLARMRDVSSAMGLGA
jgi:hypothetical protein